MRFKFSKLLGCGVALAASLYLAGTAMADTVTVWSGAATYGGSNVCSNGGGTSCGTPDGFSPTAPSGSLGTFSGTVTGPGALFNFQTSSTNMDQNLQAFLEYGGDTYSGPNQTSVAQIPGGDTATAGMNNDIMEFTGTVYLISGHMYSFTHDDGMYLCINAACNGSSDVIDSGNPVYLGTSSFTWGAASGAYGYSLWYEESNGAPGALESPDFGVTPEPSTLLLLGTGFMALAFLLFRKRVKPSVSNALVSM